MKVIERIFKIVSVPVALVACVPVALFSVLRYIVTGDSKFYEIFEFYMEWVTED
jgi:hypothetical protein